MTRYWFRRRIPVTIICAEKIVIEEVPDDYELQLIITPLFVKQKTGDTDDDK